MGRKKPNHRGFPAGILTILAFASVLSLAPAAEARLDFTSPRTLSEGSAPQLAIDPADRATVVWQRADDTSPGSIVQSMLVAANGSPGGVRTLSGFHPWGVDYADFPNPQVAVDAQGRATIVWQRVLDTQLFVGRFMRIESVRVEPDGTPGEVRTLAETDPASGVLLLDPQVAVDAQGRATVIWKRNDSGTSVHALRLDADGNPGAVQTLGSTEFTPFYGGPQLAVDPQGRATVVWTLGGGAKSAQSVRLEADGTPGPVRTVSKGNAIAPQVAVDPKGRATVVWWHSERRNRTVQSVRLDADGTPGRMKTLSAVGKDKNAVAPQVAVDSKGRATVVWQRWHRRDQRRYRVQTTQLDADGSQGNVDTLSDKEAHAPQVAVDSKGRATVAWSRVETLGDDRQPISRIEAVRLDTSGDGGAVDIVSQVKGGDFSLLGDPQVAVDSRNRPVVVWWDDENLGTVRFSRGRDRG